MRPNPNITVQTLVIIVMTTLLHIDTLQGHFESQDTQPCNPALFWPQAKKIFFQTNEEMDEIEQWCCGKIKLKRNTKTKFLSKNYY